MKYRRALESGIVVASTRAEHAEQLEELHRAVFPTLAEDQRYRAAHFLRHVEQFPEGQFVALDGDRVVGMTTTILLQFDLANPSHRLAGRRPPAGPPPRPERGLALRRRPRGPSQLSLPWHRAGALRGAPRHGEEVRARGQVAVGAPASYGRLATEMSAEEYYRSLVSGRPPIPRSRPSGRSASSCGRRSQLSRGPGVRDCGILLVLDGVRDVESA